MPTPPTEPTRTALRDFILKRFSRDEFFIFAADEFPDFYEKYEGSPTDNVSLADKLVAHCERRDALLRLQASLHAQRPELYEEAFGRFQLAAVPRQPRDPRQVFISYSTKDTKFAVRLARDMRAAGLSVWISDDSIAKGELWAAAIDRGLSECGVFVVALTPNAVQSDWVRQETAYALQTRQRGQMQLFPLLVQACEVEQLSSLLTTLEYVNFERDYDEGFASLSRAMGVTQLGSKRSERFEPLTPSLQQPPPPAAAVVSKWQQRVEAALTRQDWPEAARLINNQLELDPDDPAALAAQTRLRELQRAAQTAARAAQLRESQHLMEEAWADENWAEAARHAAIVLQLMPDNTRAERVLKLSQTKLAALRSQNPPGLLTLAAGVTLEMVRIPAGDFLYGENKQKMAQAEFWMGKTPVTVAQYWAFLQATKHPRSGYWHWDEAKRRALLNHPAVDVNWEDANAFCTWASQVTSCPLSLPSEHEWEKAARGTDGREYPWGPEAPDNTRCNFGKYDDWQKASDEDNYKFTTAVGSFSPKGDSPYKLQDMAGNVWEWCADWYDSSNKARVVRGGAFYYNGRSLRCAYRYNFVPASRDYYLGFRVSASHLSNL